MLHGVADGAYRRQALAGGVTDLPVLIALTRVDRAGIAAARCRVAGGANMNASLVDDALDGLFREATAELILQPGNAHRTKC
jgi:hypothetical protein